MGKVRWPSDVVGQIHSITAYIAQHDPRAAADISYRLFVLGAGLDHFAHRGRPTEEGLRQLTGVPPYVLTYEVIGEDVTILDVRHGRRLPYQRRS